MATLKKNKTMPEVTKLDSSLYKPVWLGGFTQEPLALNSIG